MESHVSTQGVSSDVDARGVYRWDLAKPTGVQRGVQRAAEGGAGTITASRIVTACG
jgi:hypothetical protein